MTPPTRSWTTGLGIKAVVTLLLSVLLVSCGSGKKYNEFRPSRILSVGDAMSYVSLDGTGAAVNLLTSIDPATSKTDHWLWVYAAGYGLTNIGVYDPADPTGSIASKNVVFYNNHKTATAPVSGNTSSLGSITDVRAQVNTLPATPQAGDLVVLSIGMGDVFALADGLGTTAMNTASRNAAVQLGLDYANLADNLYQRGFKHVLIVPAIDYSTSPYVATKSATFKSNLVSLTEALNEGVNVNCNGGCTSTADSKPYPTRAEGVWKFNVYDVLRNIALNTPYSYAANVNTNGPLVCLAPTLLANCASLNPINTLYDANGRPYYYSGDLFMTPILHRYAGNYLFSFSTGYTGF